MKTRTRPSIPQLGDRVRVLPPYVGNGQHGRDDFTGHAMWVVGTMAAGWLITDYQLASTRDGSWEVIMRASRVRKMRAARS